MKTNTFNYFRNAFALIGFFIIACSVATTEDDSPDDIAPIAQSNNGKYQIVHYTNNYFIVLNTASGSVKTFKHINGGTWEDENVNATFTH